MAPGKTSSKPIQSNQRKGNGLREIEVSSLVPDEVCKNCGLTLFCYAGLGIAIKIPRMAEILSM